MSRVEFRRYGSLLTFIDQDSCAAIASVPGINIENLVKGRSLYLTVRNDTGTLLDAVRIEDSDMRVMSVDHVSLVDAMGKLDDWALTVQMCLSVKRLAVLLHDNLIAAISNITSFYADANLRKERDMEDDKVYRLIQQADRCRKEIVLCLLGKPGIGKTEAVERFARDNGRNVVHIIASQILPTEVSGMTMPNQEARSMDVFDHYRLSHMKDGDILFFDELLKGQQQVLNACLTLIQERRLMSGTELPDVLIIAAANPLASPTQLPLEIRQRFVFVDVTWRRDGWIRYMEGLGFHAEAKEWKHLTERIESDLNSELTPNWNTLTPRTATKMMIWLRDSGCDEGVRGFIASEFGAPVADLMLGIVSPKESKPSPSDVIKEFVRKRAWEIMPADACEELTDIIDGKEDDLRIDDYQDIMDVLRGLDNWDQIREEIKDIDLKDII